LIRLFVLLALVVCALLAASEAREIRPWPGALCVDAHLGFHRWRMYAVIVKGRNRRRDAQS
jgi:hypothetical protein